jgi:adenylate kinase family enzyme
MASKSGTNINAPPFVPGKLRAAAPAAPPSFSPPAATFAPHFYSGPPHMIPGGGAFMPPPAAFFPGGPGTIPPAPPVLHPAALYPPLGYNLYPGYNGGPTLPGSPLQLPSQQPPAKASYNSILRSKGTPGSPIVTPTGAAQAPEQPKPAEAPLPAMTKPLVVLVLGSRGSGKTTQVGLIAQRFNLMPFFSGDVVRSGRMPMPELRRLVEENFGPSAPTPRKYNGIVLDRCITAGDMDVYYLQWALSAAPDLGIPLTFLLMMDWEAAMQRAEKRDSANADAKPKSMQRRMIEHRAQFDACENIYAPLKLLKRIDCEDQTIAAVSLCMENIIKEHILAVNSRTFVPPANLPARFFDGDVATMQAVVDFNLFTSLKQETHAVLHNTTGTIDYAPVSQMSAMVEPSLFDSTRKRKYMAMSFATLKADGKRLLLVKHRDKGIFGFPQSFQCVYDLGLMFANFSWPQPPACASSAAASSSPIEFLLDCEVVRTKRSTPTIMAFDFVYFFGEEGKRQPFSARLAKLVAYFAGIPPAAAGTGASPLELKEYVPLCQLRNLLPDYSKPPFPIDGIVIQADAEYKFGATREIMKWKPSSQCTVDFRLFGGVPPPAPSASGSSKLQARTWVFTGKVQVVHPDKGIDEETYPNCVIHVSDDDVEKYNLSDGAVVECVKAPAAPPQPQPKGAKPGGVSNAVESSVWTFVRLRADKMLPNRLEVAQSIERINHMSYDELLKTCDSLTR